MCLGTGTLIKRGARLLPPPTCCCWFCGAGDDLSPCSGLLQAKLNGSIGLSLGSCDSAAELLTHCRVTLRLVGAVEGISPVLQLVWGWMHAVQNANGSSGTDGPSLPVATCVQADPACSPGKCLLIRLSCSSCPWAYDFPSLKGASIQGKILQSVFTGSVTDCSSAFHTFSESEFCIKCVSCAVECFVTAGMKGKADLSSHEHSPWKTT